MNLTLKFMNKKIITLVVLTGLFCVAGFALAQVEIKDPLGGTTFPLLLGKIVKAVGGLIAILGTIMVIVAGIFYLTSAGSQERIGAAKKTLTYAIVGIAIGLAAQTIVDAILAIIK
jgi:hypothetical protein